MLYTNQFFYNNHFEKDNKKYDLLQMMQKACFIHQDNSGIFSLLSLGYRLEKKIISVVEREMENVGFSQIRLSLLQDSDLWVKSKRFEGYGSELFKVINRKQHVFCLSATGEELITSIYRDFYQRQQANLHVFQVGNKYRDEMRSRNGLCRAKEFVMKDGYSFCSKEEDLDKIYEVVKIAYLRIFKLFGLDVHTKVTSSGEMGGDFSEEFFVKSSLADNDEGDLEIAHIFKLGDNYSQKFDLIDNNGDYVKMACYGIGISRLMMLLLEKQLDSYGFYGTRHFNTFDYIITAIDYCNNEEVRSKSMILYKRLLDCGVSVLLDNRNVSAGKKLSDSELIGIRKRIVISRQNLEADKLEVLSRETGEKRLYSWEGVLDLQ